MGIGAPTTLMAALFVTLDFCVAADRNSLEDAIVSFPDPANYRPDEAVRSVNILISAGREASCQALSGGGVDYQLGTPGDEVNEKVLLLCRLLFTATNSARPLLPPLDAGFMPVHRDKSYRRPAEFPFVVTNGVPLLLPRITNIGPLIGGVAPEGGGKYVAMCKDFGTFRTEPFPIVTLTSASNALNQILESPEWKALRWGVAPSNYWRYLPEGEAQLVSADWAEKHMRQQVENMNKPAGHRAVVRLRLEPDPF